MDKLISQDRIVILDSTNYIKGFRYEMHCLVRAARTTHCVIYLQESKENCLLYRTQKMA